MATQPPRAIVFGIDSVSIKLTETFAAEGALPHMARLMERGATLPALTCLPAYTPTNWTTLATGAEPGTHGAGNWDDRAPGDPLDRQPMSTFDSRALTAETIWEAAERQGLTSLVIAYPGAWPSRLEKGMIAAPLPRGLWSLDLVPGCEYVMGCQGRDGVRVTAQRAEGWPEGPPDMLQVALPVGEAGPRDASRVGAVEDGAAAAAEEREAQVVTFWLLLPKGDWGYRRALLFDAYGAPRPVAELTEGQWGDWIIREFPTPAGPRMASLRFKLLELRADGGRLRLLRSAVYPTTDFTDPADLSAELVREVGPYFEHAALARARDLASYQESVFEEMEYQADWHARAAAYLHQTRGWDLFYNHWHFPDSVQHHFLSQADPDSPHYDPTHAEAYRAVLRRSCEIGDRLLGGLMRLAGPETYVAVVSDHGNASNKYVCDLPRRLREVGLLRSFGAEEDSPDDWSRTLAYRHSGFQVNVNLKGREPHGQVEPGQYEAIQERIIDALLDWRTADGKRAVAFALKRRDAALLGYWGKRVGDVVFIYNAGFAWGKAPGEASIGPAPPGANHGPQIPTAETALSSNLATWLIAGPGIKPGYRRDPSRLGPARLIDFVPTLCHALGIAPPAHCQGAVAHDIFEG